MSWERYDGKYHNLTWFFLNLAKGSIVVYTSLNKI